MPPRLSLTGIHEDINFTLKKEFVQGGVSVDRGEWQALRDNRPQTKTREVYDVGLDLSVPDTIQEWQEFCHPNLPWAEDHFQERVGGEPLNPGEQYKNWPWYEQGVEEHKGSGKFSHTYMERMWGSAEGAGELEDLITLLQRRPFTRQAFIPIWWPIDLVASKNGHRVPCSIGYLFQIQDGYLECYYYLRSCDFVRYMWDDIYMAGRLMQWVAERSGFDYTAIGQLHVKIANLHIFEAEFPRIRKEYEDEWNTRLSRVV